MTEPPLSRELTDFIRTSLPSYSAAEVLVRMAREPVRAWTPQVIVETVPPLSLTPEAAREYLEHFVNVGLIRAEPEASYCYRPSSEELNQAVTLLMDAYDRRPVTLIRTITSIATAKIQSFADSFRLSRD